MGILDFFKEPDVNQGVKEYLATPDGVLLDVRSAQEYREGHIPGSINLPLQRLEDAEEVLEDVDAPVYVYCRSGNRSRQAVAMLRQLGYSGARNIGGIVSYSGELER